MLDLEKLPCILPSPIILPDILNGGFLGNVHFSMCMSVVRGVFVFPHGMAGTQWYEEGVCQGGRCVHVLV